MNNMLLKSMILLISLYAVVTAGSYQVDILENSVEKLHLHIRFDEPLLTNMNNQAYAGYDRAHLIVDQNGALVPVISELFNFAADKDAGVAVRSVEKGSRRVENYFMTTPPEAHYPPISEIATVTYLGKYRDLPLHSLKIYPVQYLPEKNELTWIKSIEIEITTAADTETNRWVKVAQIGKNGMFDRFLINGKQSVYKAARTISPEMTEIADANNLITTFDPATTFKIMVNKTGLYKITYRDLLDSDYPVEMINPRQLRLFNKGREVAVYFKGEGDGALNTGDYFEFWGEKNERTFLDQYPDQYADPFSAVNLYWLVYGNGNGRRYIEESGGIINTGSNYVFEPYAFRETIHYEEDNYHENFGHFSSNVNRPAYEFDHWFFDSGIMSQEGGAYDFWLPHPFESGSDVVVKAVLRGKSYNDVYNPLIGHEVQLKLRGKDNIAKLVGSVKASDRWQDQTMKVISNADSAQKISQSHLKHGTNRLEIDMFQAGVSDIVLLNWFEISYLRKYRADSDFLKFHVDEDFFNNSYINLGDVIRINADGFTSSDIDVYKLGLSKLVNAAVEQFTGDSDNNAPTSYRVSIQDRIFDTRTKYVAVTEKAKLKPLSIDPFKSWKKDQQQRSLLDKTNAANFLIITNNLLHEQSLQLKAIKDTDPSLKVEVVRVENIYDAFNHGIVSPLAIKDFLRYAYNHWDQSWPLQYVVLVGDASYNYKSNPDMVPTIMYQTQKFGSASSDYQYALISGDDYVPDIAVSRIPAGSSQQLLNYIAKIEAYQSDPELGAWRNSALFISGNDAGGGDRENLTNAPIFRAQNLRMINMQLPQSMFAHRLNTVKDESIQGYDPAFGSTTDLIEYFDDGVSFINFFGHGGGAIWADVQLLNLNDVDRLNNAVRLPFVASMTCFTGAFENPGRISLGEKLVVAEDKGAIAFLGASGVGWKYNDGAILWSLFDYLWDDGIRFGEAVDLMKIGYLANPIYYTEEGSFYTWGYSSLFRSMVSQYNLFGDPTLIMQKPVSELKVTLDNYNPAPAEEIKIQISGAPSSGTGEMLILDGEGRQLDRQTFTVNAGGNTLSFTIPEDTEGKSCVVKAYVNSDQADASGQARFAVLEPIIRSIETIPQTPKVDEAISFKLHLKSKQPIESMQLKNFHSENYAQTYNDVILMEQVSDTLFQSTAEFSGFRTAGKQMFDVFIQESSGENYLYRWQKLTIRDDRPDVAIDGETLRFSGKDRFQIEFEVRNLSDIPLADIEIACYDEAGRTTNIPFARPVLSLESRQSKKVTVDYDSLAVQGNDRFRIVADANNQIDERDESNNIAEKRLTASYIHIQSLLGTSADGENNGPVGLENYWQLFISKNVLQTSTVMQYEMQNIKPYLAENNQKDLKPVLFGDMRDTVGIEINFLNDAAIGQLNATLYVDFDSTDYNQAELSRLSFFRYDPRVRLWIKQNSHRENDRLESNIQKSGLYAIFFNNDNEEPHIEITADGRPLINDMLVVRKPSIALLFQDKNGIDINNSLRIIIDDHMLYDVGQEVQQEEVTLPDSLENASAVSVLLTPQLDTGEHLLIAEAADASGNVSREELRFKVTEGFDIIVYGNYPNPFKDQTIISYYINSDNEIDDFSIKIYTTSGRLIRSDNLELDPSVSGDNIRKPLYHELIWDGTDEDGISVANGVYFAMIKGRYKGKTVKHILKMAKIQ